MQNEIPPTVCAIIYPNPVPFPVSHSSGRSTSEIIITKKKRTHHITENNFLYHQSVKQHRGSCINKFLAFNFCTSVYFDLQGIPLTHGKYTCSSQVHPATLKTAGRKKRQSELVSFHCWIYCQGGPASSTSGSGTNCSTRKKEGFTDNS